MDSYRTTWSLRISSLQPVKSHQALLMPRFQTSSAERCALSQVVRGAGSSFGFIHSMTFRTHAQPPIVINYRLSLLRRSLPNTLENFQRPTNLSWYFKNSQG